MSALEEVKARYGAMASEARPAFLARLLYFMSEAARECYPEGGQANAQNVAGLRAFNEAAQVATKQLMVALGAEDPIIGYPDAKLIEALTECFESGEIPPNLYLRPLYDAFRRHLATKT